MRDEGDRRRLRRWAIAGIAAVALGVAGVVLTYTPLFAARDIRLEGVGAMPRAEVLRLAGIDGASNLFHLDTRLVEHRLETDARILDARVTTSLPHGLRIAIVRRVPVAVVGTPEALVGADGVVIGPARSTPDLPSLTTPGGFPATGEDLAAAAEVAAAMPRSLRRDVDTVVVEADGSLGVRLSLGFWAALGDRSDLEAKAASLAALVEWAGEQGVTIVSADVSVPGSPTALLERGGSAISVPST